MRRSPATPIAIAALFVALGGTAIAVDSKLGSSDIARDAIRSKHIKDGQVRPRDLGTAQTVTEPAQITLGGGTEDTEAGPLTTLAAKEGDLLQVQARVTIGVDGPGTCYVALRFEGPTTDGKATIMSGTVGADGVMYIVPGTVGSKNPPEATGRLIPIEADGSYELELEYEAFGGTTTCDYSDKNLYTALLR